MSILEITSVTTKFVVAEMEYVRLIQQTVDFESKGVRGMTPSELRAVREAKQRCDALESEMFAVFSLFESSRR